jgi:hypothetical protein
VESFSINSRDNQQKNLLEYIATKEDSVPVEQKHAITLTLETKLVKSKDSGLSAFRITNDPKAPAVQIKEEELRKRYCWDNDQLTKKLKETYSDFKQNKVFWGILRGIKEIDKFCWQRPYNPEKLSSGSKPYYDPNVLNEFDKYYTRKDKKAEKNEA